MATPSMIRRFASTHAPKYWMVQYSYVDNILEKRKPFRPEHLALAKASKEKGEILMGGAFANPPDGAAFIFQTNDKTTIQDFIQNDPYVKNDLVTNYTIREWTVVNL